jgi:hypothetical protein
MSCLTPEEEYRLTGTLSGDNAVLALDAKEAMDALDPVDIAGEVREAMSQYPDEDFLEHIVDRIHDLIKNVRGANKETLQGVLEALHDAQMCQMYATEYGMEKLNGLIKQTTPLK